jgi:hypothetical protein
MNDGRILSDADAEAIAAALEKRLEDRFMVNLGKGVWALIWKAAIVLLVAIAAYGVGTSSGAFSQSTGVPR